MNKKPLHMQRLLLYVLARKMYAFLKAVDKLQFPFFGETEGFRYAFVPHIGRTVAVRTDDDWKLCGRYPFPEFGMWIRKAFYTAEQSNAFSDAVSIEFQNGSGTRCCIYDEIAGLAAVFVPGKIVGKNDVRMCQNWEKTGFKGRADFVCIF